MRRQLVLLALIAALEVSACGLAGPRTGPTGPAASTPASTAGTASAVSTLTLTSPAVSEGRLLSDYRCEPKVGGVEASIPLAWSGVPSGTGSLAVTMHHYPFPGDTTRVSAYLLLWGIPPTAAGIAHGHAGDGPWSMGADKDGTAVSYTSPCSQGPGTREYTITLYALSETPPSLPDHSSLDVTYEVLTKAISTVRVLGTATLTFTDTTP